MLCHIITAYCQDVNNIKFDHLSSENLTYEKGLSQNTVNCMLQDSKGYLWFGTWDGLNKYDGYQFVNFDKQSQLSGQTIYALHEDNSGALWIGTDGGLTRYDRKKNRFTQFIHDPENPNSLLNNVISSIVEDRLGNLWIGTMGGLNKFDKITGTFYPYLHLPRDNNPFRSNCINHLSFDNNGNLWIATQIGLVFFNISEQIITRYYHNPNDRSSLPDNLINTVQIDNSGLVWVGTAHGLSRLDPATGRVKTYAFNREDRFSLSHNNVSVIFQDRNGLFWIGTEGGGLNIFDKMEEKFITHNHESNNLNSLSNNRVLSIIEDNKGSIWVGTFIGVNKFDRFASKFDHYKHVPDENNCLNNNYVLSFLEDENRIVWIGTGKGINLFDRNRGLFSYITHDPGNQHGLTSNQIRTVFKDSRGFIWIGTFDDGLNIYDPATGLFTHFQHNPKDPGSISHNDILSVMEDYSGNIWIGTNGGGLNRFVRPDSSFISYRTDENDPFSISHDAVWTIMEDRREQLWVGTGNGLNRFDRNDDKFEVYKSVQDDSNILLKWIFYIYEDDSGIFWLGTKGDGLIKFDVNTGKARGYKTEDGLANNVVYAALDDKQGNLWISTNWGLSKFNKETELFINYGVNDGVQGNEFNNGAYFMNKDGEIYFGGMNGFNLFHPSEITTNPNSPVTVITSLKIFNQLMPLEIDNGDTIHLSEDDNFFTLGFSALDYTNPPKNKYRYRLENYDKITTYTDAGKRYAEYTNVSPGTYTFRAFGTNNDGLWDENGVTLTIIITPHWYNTWLFRITLIFIMVLLTWYFIYKRIKAIRKKHDVEKKVLAIEKQLYDTELQALRLQMNPHFIFNTLNSIQSYILSSDLDKAVEYLGKFSQLMRLILSNSREPFISIAEEVKALTYYLDIEKLRFDNKFEYSISIDPAIDEEFMEIPPMLVQPYVENAIIHGLIHKEGKGNIKINLKLDGTLIVLAIEDIGIGREKAMQIKRDSGLQRKSRGMLITMERLQVLNKKNKQIFRVNVIDMKDDKGLPTGTRVELKISYRES